MKSIAILLTTYNSAKYLREQIDSILSQTYKEWQLFIHDDMSQDETMSIISSYEEKDPRIHFLNDTVQRGSAGSFMWMLEQVYANYYMLCDHDDVWLPQKIESSLLAMLSSEKNNTSNPLIVACDAKIVDAKLNILNNSFWKHCHTRRKYFTDKYYYLFYNNIPGCTMMLNNAARLVSLPFREGAFIHDSWIIASVLWNGGSIITINQPLMLYRLHDSNLIGSKESPSLFEQVLNIRKLTVTTRQRYYTATTFTDMSFLHYLLLKSKYLLLFHWERLIDKNTN